MPCTGNNCWIIINIHKWYQLKLFVKSADHSGSQRQLVEITAKRLDYSIERGLGSEPRCSSTVGGEFRARCPRASGRWETAIKLCCQQYPYWHPDGAQDGHTLPHRYPAELSSVFTQHGSKGFMRESRHQLKELVHLSLTTWDSRRVPDSYVSSRFARTLELVPAARERQLFSDKIQVPGLIE